MTLPVDKNLFHRLKNLDDAKECITLGRIKVCRKEIQKHEVAEYQYVIELLLDDEKEI